MEARATSFVIVGSSRRELWLSPSERRILVAAANGLTTGATARLHVLGHGTVHSQRKNIMRRWGCRNITQAVAMAWRACLLTGDDIVGGPIPTSRRLTRDEVVELLLTKRQRERFLPPPAESWSELRARAARLAAQYRARPSR